VAVFLQAISVEAQNLVVNGGFETRDPGMEKAQKGKPGPGENLLVNGGFEEWVDKIRLSKNLLTSKPVSNVITGEKWPLSWVPGCTPYAGKGLGEKGSVEIDESQAHSGQFSLRVANRSMTATTHVDFQPEPYPGKKKLVLEPNSRYILSWWVKGENIRLSEELKGGGKGAMMFSYYLTKDNKRVYKNKSLLLEGSYGWQQQSVVFSTGSEGGEFSMSLQLRFATGTLWYDDVRLEKLGPTAFAPGWERNVEQAGACSRVATDVARSGSRSLLLEQRIPLFKPPEEKLQSGHFDIIKYFRSINSGGHVLVSQKVPVTPGKYYSLSFWFQTDGLLGESRDVPERGYAHFQVWIFWLDENGKSVKNDPHAWVMNRGRNAPAWTKSENDRFAQPGGGKPVLCPEGAATAMLRFALNVYEPEITPRVWIDDVKLQEVE
jgi:hypothetical protein